MGVILPKDLVDQQHLKENDKVVIFVVKETDLSDVYGTLKTGKTGQQLKDLARKGW